MSERTLVIRFSSLGDVVLCGAVTGGLAPVTFLTKRAWAEAAALLPGVEEVLIHEEVDAATLAGPWARVLDLHGNLRSRRVRARGPWSQVARHDLRRRLRVALKLGAPPPRVVERYAAAAGLPVAPRPWIPGHAPDDLLVLCPGAAHATKRWPAARFAAVGRAWEGPVAVLGGPGDTALVREVAAAVGPTAEAVAERGFGRTLPLLRRARVAVSGDTGLMHLASAVGVPVVGLFGPTTGADGFWDPTAPGVLVEADLPCRPCSRHGGPACPIGDHACMDGIAVEAVVAAVARLAEAPCAG